MGALVRAGVLDAELAGLVSLLLGARVPVVVAGLAGESRDGLLEAMVDLLPPDARVFELAGEPEEFEWLPEATELGWRRAHAFTQPVGRDAIPRADPSSAVLLARDLGGDGTSATGGERARLVVRALALGYGLVAAMSGDRLEAVLDSLGAAPISADDDESSRLGLVVVLGDTDVGARVRVAHYVRPVSRDTGGHVQRLPPAVLATWNAPTDTWDHFAWGVLPELAIRIGMRPIEFEREQARRAADLRMQEASAT
jgi:hypothetical protein